jgi:hypothetical protein
MRPMAQTTVNRRLGPRMLVVGLETQLRLINQASR